MAKYSHVKWLDALYLLGTRAFTYLLTYTVGSGVLPGKPEIFPKRLKIERKLLLTANIYCVPKRKPPNFGQYITLSNLNRF